MKQQVWSLAALACLPLAASAQCDPGPATGTTVNRCYDDGFVYVDVTGNSHGFTWYWGYVDAAQVQDGYLVFHSHTILAGNTVQVLTDQYFLAGLIPPAAPYVGGFASSGPLLYAEPASRMTNTLAMPPLSIQRSATNSVVVSWPSSSALWTLEQNSTLAPANWTDVSAKPADDGTTTSVTISRVIGTQFYRLRLLP